VHSKLVLQVSSEDFHYLVECFQPSEEGWVETVFKIQTVASSRQHSHSHLETNLELRFVAVNWALNRLKFSVVKPNGSIHLACRKC
jgi:hypothetical protein